MPNDGSPIPNQPLLRSSTVNKISIRSSGLSNFGHRASGFGLQPSPFLCLLLFILPLPANLKHVQWWDEDPLMGELPISDFGLRTSSSVFRLQSSVIGLPASVIGHPSCLTSVIGHRSPGFGLPLFFASPNSSDHFPQTLHTSSGWMKSHLGANFRFRTSDFVIGLPTSVFGHRSSVFRLPTSSLQSTP